MSILTEDADMGMDGGFISKGTDLAETLWEMQQNMPIFHAGLCLLYYGVLSLLLINCFSGKV